MESKRNSNGMIVKLYWMIPGFGTFHGDDPPQAFQTQEPEEPEPHEPEPHEPGWLMNRTNRNRSEPGPSRNRRNRNRTNRIPQRTEPPRTVVSNEWIGM